MTKITFFSMIIGMCLFIGCAEQASENLSTPGTADAATEEVIELSSEEIEILDASAESSQVDLGEINADNYEEALEKLEQELDSE